VCREITYVNGAIVKILKVLFFGLLGVLLLLLGMSAWFSPEGFPAGSVTDQRAAMARYLVHTESLQLVDPTRVTQARNGVAEASGREFKGKLFAPISQKTSDNFPLLSLLIITSPITNKMEPVLFHYSMLVYSGL